MGDTSASGRRVQPQPDDGRAGALGRLPPERAGRGRRLRCAQHARPVRARGAAPRRARAADRHHAHARAPLPRHAGHRVHDRGRHALHAADAQREAPCAGGRPGRRRHGRRGGPDPRRGADAHRREQARGAAAPDVRPELLLHSRSPGASRPRPARRRAASSSPPRRRSSRPRTARRSSWSGPSPRPRTSPGFTPRGGSSPRRAARPRTPRWWRAAWGDRAWRAPRGCASTSRRAR